MREDDLDYFIFELINDPGEMRDCLWIFVGIVSPSTKEERGIVVMKVLVRLVRLHVVSALPLFRINVIEL